MMVLNVRVLKDWEALLRNRREMATRCWDHLSQTPFQPVGSRYGPLKPPMDTFTFEGSELPQWQYEIDNAARVKVALGKDFVVVVRVATGHPKENE